MTFNTYSIMTLRKGTLSFTALFIIMFSIETLSKIALSITKFI